MTETPRSTDSDPSSPDPELDTPSSDFARALEQFETGDGTSAAAAAAGAAREIQPGMKVRGQVISIGGEHAVIDFGGRSEGVAELHHFRSEAGPPTINVGDTLELFVVEAGDQIVLAPSVKADPHAALKHVREAKAAGMPISGKVVGLNAGGLEVDLGGVRGFCPVSQIEAGFCADPSIYVGKTLEFTVTAVEEGRKSAVVSRRQLLRRAEEEQAKVMLATMKPGDELEGKVARVEPFGAFVDLGGVDGLVHVSEIRHERVGNPRDVIRAGEKVRVRVLKIDTGKDGKPRIALSIKAAAPDPWSGIEQRFTPGMRVNGTVARLTDFGAFVTLAPGIDGLVHVSEAAPHRVGHVKEVLSVGQPIEAAVLAVDPAKKRISLSVRQVVQESMPPPRTPASGDVVEGRVAGIKPFGVFIDLPEYGARVTGLLPREESGQPRGGDLSKVFAMGDTFKVEVYEVKGDRIRVRPVDAVAAPRAAAAERKPEANAKPSDEPPTTMAIALRKAMEEAEQKRRQGR